MSAQKYWLTEGTTFTSPKYNGDGRSAIIYDEVIRAKWKSSLLQGKGSIFISQYWSDSRS